MKKRTWIVLGILLALFFGSVAILRIFQLDLVHVAVVNALIQKAPADQATRIRAEFSAARRTSIDDDLQEHYMKTLFEISQMLEKTQRIDIAQLEEILASLEPAAAQRAR